MRAVSLRDVAARAGVSVKTVSNVVNGYVHVRPETRDRVQRALSDLNYRPNLSARNLRGSRSGIIALALPELDAPYFAELSRSIIKAAEARAWTVLIDQTDGLLEREAVVLDGIRDHLIDGLIFSPLAVGRSELQQRSDQTPMVLLGEAAVGGADHVAIDNVAAAREATEHLIGLGRRRIAAIGTEPQEGTGRQRFTGYRQALRAAGLPTDRSLIRPVPTFHRRDGAATMEQLLGLEEPPDAVFCFTDLLALGAIRTLLSHGLQVPRDVAVVGFDDIEDGRFSTPTLTTISPDKDQIARTAVDLLASRIGGQDSARPREIVAGHRLIARESTVGR
ncbi:MAG TPA: LacI family DNA-binding transcriptional regulator [Mycobacteriales bacterium]|nr:LacI family DNA-binding transcriptional regulator [Mycobacteriales bacterium]